jgi:hypothetical protein
VADVMGCAFAFSRSGDLVVGSTVKTGATFLKFEIHVELSIVVRPPRVAPFFI